MIYSSHIKKSNISENSNYFKYTNFLIKHSAYIYIYIYTHIYTYLSE